MERTRRGCVAHGALGVAAAAPPRDAGLLSWRRPRSLRTSRRIGQGRNKAATRPQQGRNTAASCCGLSRPNCGSQGAASCRRVMSSWPSPPWRPRVSRSPAVLGWPRSCWGGGRDGFCCGDGRHLRRGRMVARAAHVFAAENIVGACARAALVPIRAIRLGMVFSLGLATWRLVRWSCQTA